MRIYAIAFKWLLFCLIPFTSIADERSYADNLNLQLELLTPDGDKTQPLMFNVTLQNTSDHTLNFTVSTNPAPLSLSVWNNSGFNLSLQVEAGTVKNRTNPAKAMRLYKGEKIIMKSGLDINQYRRLIKEKDQIYVVASYTVVQHDKGILQSASVHSNKVMVRFAGTK
jgi:hypothetical protein